MKHLFVPQNDLSFPRDKKKKAKREEERKKKEEERESSALSSGRKIINISTSQPSTGQEEGEGAET